MGTLIQDARIDISAMGNSAQFLGTRKGYLQKEREFRGVQVSGKGKVLREGSRAGERVEVTGSDLGNTHVTQDAGAGGCTSITMP